MRNVAGEPATGADGRREMEGFKEFELWEPGDILCQWHTK